MVQRAPWGSGTEGHRGHLDQPAGVREVAQDPSGKEQVVLRGSDDKHPGAGHRADV